MDVKVTWLETCDPVGARPDGDKLVIEQPDSLLGKVPFRQCYVFKIAGLRQ
jgi:hypothetical protein